MLFPVLQVAAILAIAALSAKEVLVDRLRARAVLLYLSGRAFPCTFSEVLEAKASQITGGGGIRKMMRVVGHDPTGFDRWQTPYGLFWMPTEYQATLHYDMGEQNQDIFGPGRGVRSGDVVLDCGAHVGIYARRALQRGARLVIAIEPSPKNLACLRRNLADAIQQGRVIVYPKGAWDRDDTLVLHMDPRSAEGDSVSRQQDGFLHSDQIPLTTIDHMMAELHLPRVDFIKMDLGGAEQRAIRGARETIARFHPRMAICVCHLPQDPVNVPRLVAEEASGYRRSCQCFVRENTVNAEVMHFY